MIYDHQDKFSPANIIPNDWSMSSNTNIFRLHKQTPLTKDVYSLLSKKGTTPVRE